VTRIIKRRLRRLSPGQYLKLSFRRHYIRNIVTRYNNRAARDVQIEAYHRRHAATAVPVSDQTNPSSSSATSSPNSMRRLTAPELIAPASKEEAMREEGMRPISVDMVTPYQGRFVLDEEEEEGEQQGGGEVFRDPRLLEAIDEESHETKCPLGESGEDEGANPFMDHSLPPVVSMGGAESYEASSLIFGDQTPLGGDGGLGDENEEEKAPQRTKKKRRSKSLSLLLLLSLICPSSCLCRNTCCITSSLS
jgi:hypothetical protein